MTENRALIRKKSDAKTGGRRRGGGVDGWGQFTAVPRRRTSVRE
jgi:hypothetical protein